MAMNEYVGKVCPFCKTKFEEGDDIVVCSTCDMPHHKDCWVENQGCTVFGCSGTIKAPDGSPTSVTASEVAFDAQAPAPTTVYCVRCGTPHPISSSFCGRCGHPLQKAALFNSASHPGSGGGGMNG